MSRGKNTELDIDVHYDGCGYDYTISRGDFLLAKGWVRCAMHVDAIQLVRDVAVKLAIRVWGTPPETDDE